MKLKINTINRILTSLILFALLYLIYSFDIALVSFLLLIGIFSVIEFSSLIEKIVKSKGKKFFINSFFILYIFLFCVIFFIFSNFIQLKILIFIILFGCIFSDIGGFVFGNFFKGAKLTKISPKKTISGSIGSLIFSYMIIQTFSFYILSVISYEILLISIVTSIACQTGDLFFSFLKRKAKVKDTGNFLPGHGGILDRVDGILLGLPLGLIFFFLIH